MPALSYNYPMKKNLAIILAGGTGTRINGELPKQFMLLKGKPILYHTTRVFENHPDIHDIFIVSHKDYIQKTKEMIEEYGFKKVIKILPGGETRQQSSYIGVNAADGNAYENVMIHDAARPFVLNTTIDGVLKKLETYDAVELVVPSPDTVVEIDDNNFIKEVPNRQYIRKVLTPQSFKSELIREAHRLALEKGIYGATDDCSLVFQLKLADVYVMEDEPVNIKITYPMDLHIGEKILEMFPGIES